MKVTRMLSALAVCLLCLIAARSSADEPVHDLTGVARREFEKGLRQANDGQWSSAISSFKEADNYDPDALQIWFNLAVAESNVPGYELRAAALLKAFLLRQPNAPQRDKIDKLRQKLEAALRDRIRLILVAITKPATNMPDVCDTESAMLRIAQAQLRAGLYEDAKATLGNFIEKSGCSELGADLASLVTAAAVGGDLSIAEQYEANLNNWLAGHSQKRDETELTLDYAAGMAMMPLYVARESPKAAEITLPAKEMQPYQEIMNLYDYLKSRDSSGAPVAGWYPINSGRNARLAACLAKKQGWGDLTIKEYLLRARNAVFLVPNITSVERDQELVRFGVVFYILKQQDAAVATLKGMNDPALTEKWLQNFVAANPDSTLQINEITNAFWSNQILNSPSNVRVEIETLMCLDQRLEIFVLHRIGTDGFKFPDCYLPAPPPYQSTRLVGMDSDLAACVDAAKKDPNGNAAADWQVLDGMLSLANTLSDGLNIVH